MESNTQIGSYSFDDEVIDRFYCDFEQLKIELGFSSYYKDSIYSEKPCSVVIEKWKSAKSKVWKATKFYDFPINLGIFSMLLLVEETELILKLIVNTVDDRYLEIHIETPTIAVIEL
jgi:hypothetical protein